MEEEKDRQIDRQIDRGREGDKSLSTSNVFIALKGKVSKRKNANGLLDEFYKVIQIKT